MDLKRATVTRPDGTSRHVKNLGWLLRHWRETVRIVVEPHPRGCVLTATMTDGTVYATAWADVSLCREWLHRPTFEGIDLSWFGTDTTC